MPRLLPPGLLAPLLDAQRDLVDQTLETIYTGWPYLHTVETLSDAALACGLSTAQILSDTLTRDGMDQQFLSILRAQGTDLLPAAGFVPDVFDDVDDDTIDPEDQAEFSRTALTGRCRIVVGGKVVGSGALISRRLVLTATHVIRDAIKTGRGLRNTAQKLAVRGADGIDYPAWIEFMSPVHENELNDLPAPDSCYDSHADVALLRIYKPLGRRHRFGHFDLTRPLPSALGKRALWLVHFPGGQDQGFSVGQYIRKSARAMYLQHNADTTGGSSGGAAFDRSFSFIGHHQGGLGENGRIVPFDRYINNAAFKKSQAGDQPPKYLWSLDESIDSHMIIGRDLFFDALTAIVEGTAVALKGIWVRRMDTSQDVGLSFSYKILNAFLQAHDNTAQTHRISLDLQNDDLIGDVSTRILGAGSVPRAAAGVARGETSLAATDKDRAKSLATALQARATETGRMQWIYFDNPPSGLSRVTQVQLEHLISEMLTRPDLRIILSGFETFNLADRHFEKIAEAHDQGPPGLVYDFIGEFRKEDLRLTVANMSDDLGLHWQPDVIDHVVDFALTGLRAVAGTYSAAASAGVAEKLRGYVKLIAGVS